VSERPVSPASPVRDAVPSSGAVVASAPFPGLVQVAGPSAGGTPFLVVAGDDDAGLCVDGVCALPGAAPELP